MLLKSIDNTLFVCYYVLRTQQSKTKCVLSKGDDEMNTSKKELDARELLEQLNRLPEAARIRVGYIIQGAALVAGNHSPQEPDPERNDPAA